MRLPERYKQTIWVSNETYLDSGEFKTPYKIRGLFTPKSDLVDYGGGVQIQGNRDQIKFESKLKGAQEINQNSLLWIKREPNSSKSNATHRVSGRLPTTSGWFITIECESTSVDVPII